METGFFAFVIAALCSLKYLGVCSLLLQYNDNQDGLSKEETSKKYDKEGMLFTENTSNDTQLNLENSPESDYIPKLELVVSDPVFGNISWNTSVSMGMHRKRGILEEVFNHGWKMQLLQLHNIYRGNVTPPAADMKYMEWDDRIAELAQIWSDGCAFKHGFPNGTSIQEMTQNLYVGNDPTGYEAVWMWYKEYHDYDIRKDSCTPGELCAHYKVMAWAESNKLGCGFKRCKNLKNRVLITCHYSPPAQIGLQIYRIGKPCSQCPFKGGSLCVKNLCMTPVQCKRNPFDCESAKCELECLNCGRLDKENCLCECMDGWDSPDCSLTCSNKHEKCGKSPGFPHKAACSMNKYLVANKFCRQMCEMCNPIDGELTKYTCCNGTLCDEGYVLDPDEEPCKCKLLCPGPLCDICSSEPPELLNGTYQYHKRGHNSEVEYECDPGYEMWGRSTVECMHGEWTGQPPDCVKDNREQIEIQAAKQRSSGVNFRLDFDSVLWIIMIWKCLQIKIFQLSA